MSMLSLSEPSMKREKVDSLPAEVGASISINQIQRKQNYPEGTMVPGGIGRETPQADH